MREAGVCSNLLHHLGVGNSQRNSLKLERLYRNKAGYSPNPTSTFEGISEETRAPRLIIRTTQWPEKTNGQGMCTRGGLWVEVWCHLGSANRQHQEVNYPALTNPETPGDNL